MGECELCKAEHRTRWFYEDNTCWIALCETCQIPMLVFSHHGGVSHDEKIHAMEVVDELFEYEYIRSKGRKILDHDHWHLVNSRLRGEK